MLKRVVPFAVALGLLCLGSRAHSTPESAKHRPRPAATRARPRAQSREALQAARILGQASIRTLRRNVVELDGKKYLAAGRTHFRSLWSRDGAFAMAYGLAPLAKEHKWARETMHDHLTAMIEHAQPKDGLVPRNLDSKVPKILNRIEKRWGYPNWRVIAYMAINRLGLKTRFERVMPMRGELVPQYVDEHGIPTLDSNALMLQAAMAYVEATGDTKWWKQHEKQLARIYRFYEGYKRKDGLIEQPPFSDWQDSVERAPEGGKKTAAQKQTYLGRLFAKTSLGKWVAKKDWTRPVDTDKRGVTFYTNILYHQVSEKLADASFADTNAFGIDASGLRKRRAHLERTFKDRETGLFRSVLGMPQFSLEGNLLAIETGFLRGETSRKRLYKDIKKHFTKSKPGLLGYNTFPAYDTDTYHTAIDLAGLYGYHDRIYWSWLMGLSAKVATQMGDAEHAKQIVSVLANSIKKHNTLHEVFDPDAKLAPLRGKAALAPYHSERDFSWGAGFGVAAAKEMGAELIAH
jgi:hypothetical protein